MSIEIKLFERLKAQVALVSNRVYATIAPQSVTKPYIVYTKITPNREYTHDGFSGLSRPRMQISCYGTSYGSAKSVATQVISALEGWHTNGVSVGFLEGEQDLYEQDTSLYHVSVDFYIHYKE